jgi:hypothetical protein
MGLYADAMNATRDVLLAAKAEGQPLAYFDGFYFGESEDHVANLGFPYLWIHLDNPMIREVWSAAKNLRGGEVTPLVDIGIETPSGSDEAANYPYGKTGEISGLLTAIADVMNVLDAGRDTILAGSKVIDMSLDVRNTQPSGQGTWTAQIVLVIKPRFRAGDR